MAEPISAAAAAFANWAYATFFAAAGYGTTAHAVISATLYYGATAVIYAGVSMGLQAVAAAQMPDPEGQKLTRRQTRPPRFMAVGGPSRMSGAYMLREAIGNKYGCVLAICEGRLANISQIYLNDDKVQLNAEGWVISQPNERYGGKSDLVRISTRLGNPTETRHTILDPHFSSYWPANARGDGIASLALFAQHRSRESFPRHFPNGEPMPSIVGTPVCFDWRDPTQDRNDQSTWKACDNPIIWFVFCEWYWFGRSWERFIQPVLGDLTEEANHCDELVPLKAGGSIKRYTVAGNCPVNTEPAAIRASILAAMDGWLSTNGKGQLALKAGRYEEPTLTITGEHIIGYSWQAFQPDEDHVNELIVSHVSPKDDYSSVEVGAWRDEADIAETGTVRSENLDLPWVPHHAQAMRLGKRKMKRLNAPRRGQLTLGLYGLNALGHRYVRVQNPELQSMADVVVEVTNIEMDLTNARVVLDVLLADPSIDDWDPAEEEGELPPEVERPEPTPANQDAAKTLRSPSVAYPLSSDHESITVAAFSAFGPAGEEVEFPAEVIGGLDELTRYGVFYRPSTGYAVEVYPAPINMATGSWYFIGWQSTSDALGEYPGNPAPPPGWGGDSERVMIQ